jgi:hypothetical protein
VADTLSLLSKWVTTGRYERTASGTVDESKLRANDVSQAFRLPNLALAYGAGTVLDNGRVQANDWFRGVVTIAATTTVTLDLIGSSRQNPWGVDLAFTSLRYVLAAVVNADGSKKVRIGPQNTANAAQLWFGGVGAQAYDEECWRLEKFSPPAGWAVTAGTGDLFVLNNPGGSSIDVALLLAGVK